MKWKLIGPKETEVNLPLVLSFRYQAVSFQYQANHFLDLFYSGHKIGGMGTQYLTLDALAARLGLPKDYLRNLVEKEQIPCLDVNGRLRFNEHNVRNALGRLECCHREKIDA